MLSHAVRPSYSRLSLRLQRLRSSACAYMAYWMDDGSQHLSHNRLQELELLTFDNSALVNSHALVRTLLTMCILKLRRVHLFDLGSNDASDYLVEEEKQSPGYTMDLISLLQGLQSFGCLLLAFLPKATPLRARSPW